MITRAHYLGQRLALLSTTLGDGPWLDAVRGRLDAALGNEPWLPWWATRADHVPSVVAWERERGLDGYLNRSARRHLRTQLLGPLRALRRAIAQMQVTVRRG